MTTRAKAKSPSATTAQAAKPASSPKAKAPTPTKSATSATTEEKESPAPKRAKAAPRAKAAEAKKPAPATQEADPQESSEAPLALAPALRDENAPPQASEPKVEVIVTPRESKASPETLTQKAKRAAPKVIVPSSSPWAKIKSEEADEGFSALMAGGLDKAIPVQELVERVRADRATCWDLKVPLSQIRLAAGSGREPILDVDKLNSEARAQVRDRGELEFSIHGFDGLGAYSSIPQRHLDIMLKGGDRRGLELACQVQNYALDKETENRGEDYEVMLRFRGSQVRATLSAKYGRIDNVWVLERLALLAPTGRVVHWREVTMDHVSGLFLIPDGIRVEKDSGYGAGVTFQNSEVGTATLDIFPSVFRSVCANGCVFGQLRGEAIEGLYRRHSGGENINLPKLEGRIYESVQKQVPLAQEAIGITLATKGFALEWQTPFDPLRVINAAGVEYGLSVEEKRGWAEGYLYEGAEPNVFSLLQGLTRSVRESKEPTGSLAAESLAGFLFDQPEDWWKENHQELMLTELDAEGENILNETFTKGLVNDFCDTISFTDTRAKQKKALAPA